MQLKVCILFGDNFCNYYRQILIYHIEKYRKNINTRIYSMGRRNDLVHYYSSFSKSGGSIRETGIGPPVHSLEKACNRSQIFVYTCNRLPLLSQNSIENVELPTQVKNRMCSDVDLSKQNALHVNLLTIRKIQFLKVGII